MDTEVLQLLERGVGALERIAEDPVLPIPEPSGPPVCPNCETVSPEIRVSESESSGPIAEYVVQAQCQRCLNIFYAIPLTWFCVRTKDEVQMEMDERKRNGHS